MKMGNRPPATEVPARYQYERMTQHAAAVINGGMVTQQDSADIQNGELQLARNVYVRFDKTMRRYGTKLITPAKPNALPVIRLVLLKRNDGTAYTLRFTPTTIHRYTDAAWIAYAGALSGTRADRIQPAVVLNRLFFTNNGKDEVQEVNFGAQTWGDLGNAPKYRYITGFYNRVVGAALADVDETEVGWSAEVPDLDEWDPLVKNTAGKSPIVDSASDLSDWVKGIFGFTNVMVVMREKSIVLANKQPVPTAPFYFYTAAPDTGTDCPHSVVPVRGGGLAFVDVRTNGVYTYFPGQQPIPIGQKIEKELFNNVSDTEQVFGSFDPVNMEYSICVPAVGTKMIQEWRINLRNKAWSYNERYDISMIEDAEFFSGGGITIDQLLGTIDNLQGTIDELSGTSTAIKSFRAYGAGDGEIAQEDPTATTDAPHVDHPNGVIYETEIVSKAYELSDIETLFSQIKVEYKAIVGGTFILEYSKDGGATTDSWRLAKSITMKDLSKPRLLTYTKVIRCRKLAWRLRATTGIFEFLKYEVNVYPGGKATK